MAVMRDIQKKLRRLWPHLNERGRRMLAAAEAADIGQGGVSLVRRVSGLSRVTITKGINELGEPGLAEERVSRAGGGGGKEVVRDRRLGGGTGSRVQPVARGGPVSPLRGTCNRI